MKFIACMQGAEKISGSVLTAGFDAMNIKTGKFTHYKNNNEDSVNKISILYNALYEDNQGTDLDRDPHWGSTKLDHKTGKIKYYRFSNGI